MISSYPDQELEGGPFGLYHLIDDQLMVALPAARCPPATGWPRARRRSSPT